MFDQGLAPLPAHVPPERIVDVDLYAMPGAAHDLHASWKELQDNSPYRLVWTPRNGGHWVALRAAEIAHIYADHANFSSRITIVPRLWGELYPLRPTTLDPPAHRPYRRVLTAALSSRTVREAEPHIRELAHTAAAKLSHLEACDFVLDYAADLPLLLFARLANVSPDAVRTLPRYAEDPRDNPDAEPIMERFAALLRDLIRQRANAPGEDIVSQIVTADVEGRRLDEDEAVELATAVLTGGLDTVVSTLALIVAHLARAPTLRERLIERPALIPAIVTEMLRRYPIMTKARLTANDQTIDGVTIRAGDMVVLPPLSGLDETMFDDALAIDLDRPRQLNATFGNGVHRCPGAQLAELELAIMLEQWLARIPHFALDPAHPPIMKGGVLGAVIKLPLRLA